ncbi:endo-alpha-1,4-polygalactosaminidase (GH114 family) [Tumebacillus sp. BK434]|uniref:putative glycoside hydrolase n=1 Tax=Tumebacillus sp. BK434 TaxID=2512169 RepID=UPI00104E7FA5|nr:endo alpha-1,4 polygalactosaminidase [Tumebacillus sp. BK434]TCP59677.1 endo-alpha-1,4-polygalactosaminidase (GH114 family) [Tumebacillus sp. BK434]
MNKMMRNLSTLCLACTLVTGVAVADTALAQPVAAVKQKPSSLTGINSYTIFYGEPKPAVLQKLTAYELVVIEPRLWTKAQVDTLKQKGVKVLGYLSVLEQYKDSDLLKQATNGDYLTIKGKRDFRSDWESWSMDINSAHYRQLLLEDYRSQVLAKGLNGVFLDTMGNADDGIWPSDVSNRQREGAVQFVASLRADFPAQTIVQNWGLTALKDRTAPYIDGILWEDFDPQVVSKDQWSQNRMKELSALKQKHGLTVLTVDIGLTGKQKTSYLQLNSKLGYVGQVIKKSYDEL